jgi:hypothetical protein
MANDTELTRSLSIFIDRTRTIEPDITLAEVENLVAEARKIGLDGSATLKVKETSSQQANAARIGFVQDVRSPESGEKDAKADTQEIETPAARQAEDDFQHMWKYYRKYPRPEGVTAVEIERQFGFDLNRKYQALAWGRKNGHVSVEDGIWTFILPEGSHIHEDSSTEVSPPAKTLTGGLIERAKVTDVTGGLIERAKVTDVTINADDSVKGKVQRARRVIEGPVPADGRTFHIVEKLGGQEVSKTTVHKALYPFDQSEKGVTEALEMAVQQGWAKVTGRTRHLESPNKWQIADFGSPFDKPEPRDFRYGHDCTNCGKSDRDCVRDMKESKAHKPCCNVCKNTSTHGPNQYDGSTRA